MAAMMRLIGTTFCAAALALVAPLVTLMAPPVSAQTSAGTSARPLIASGSSTVYPLLTDIAQRFQARNAGAAIEVRSGGSGKGIADLRAEVADIAMISRPIAENERDLFAFPLARDGAAIVVNRANTVKGINSRQLTDLLTGNITDWKQLGGRAGTVRLAWRTEGQGIPDLLLQHLKLKSEQIQKHATFF
jgi:phosphate transport system substrate-binding protein